MRNRLHQALMACLLVLTILLCTGCSSLFPYEPPEVQRPQQGQPNDGAGSAGTETRDPIDIQTTLSDDRVYTSVLRNNAGSVLATYSGRAPAFLAPSGYAVPFQRINEHFQNQYDAFRQDSIAYFERVKQYYGEDWNTVVVEEPLFHTTVTYRVLESPDHYLSVEYLYSTCLDGKTQTSYRLGEVILLDTGWVLLGKDLFGNKFEDASAQIMKDVTAWAVDRGILKLGMAVSFTAETLLKNFTLTETALILYLDPYALSADSSLAQVIELKLEDYAAWIPDVSLSEDAPNTDTPNDPVAPDNTPLPELPGISG